jgi:hypothetical protein
MISIILRHTHAFSSIHLAVGFFSTFQNASTGIQENAKVKNAAIPVATQMPITIYMGTRASLTEKMRRYCVRIETLVKVKPTQ